MQLNGFILIGWCVNMCVMMLKVHQRASVLVELLLQYVTSAI